MKPRLALITPMHCYVTGGGEISNQILVKHLVDKADILLVTLVDNNLGCLPKGVRGVTLNPGVDPDRMLTSIARRLRFGLLPPGLGVITRLLTAYKPDAILSLSHYTAGVASEAARRLGVAYGVVVRASLHPKALIRELGLLKGLVRVGEVKRVCGYLAGARRVFTVSRYLYRELAEVCGLDASSIIVDAYDPISEDEIKAAADAAERLDAIVYIGRLEPYKGVDTLLKAYARVARGGCNASLIVAGFGSLESLVERVSRLYPRVRYLGRVSHAEALRLMASSLAVVYPVRHPEPFGRTGMEAVALGKPLIVSARGGLIEAIAEARRLGVPHYVLRGRGDVEELVEALEWACSLDWVKPRPRRVWSMDVERAARRVVEELLD